MWGERSIFPSTFVKNKDCCGVGVLKGAVPGFLGGPCHKYRHSGFMNHTAGSASQNHLLKFALSVGSHDNQVKVTLLDRFYNLINGISRFNDYVFFIQRTEWYFRQYFFDVTTIESSWPAVATPFVFSSSVFSLIGLAIDCSGCFF